VSADWISGFLWVDLGALQKVLPVVRPRRRPAQDADRHRLDQRPRRLGGKTMVSVVEPPGRQGLPAAGGGLCNALTQDEQVFAAVLNAVPGQRPTVLPEVRHRDGRRQHRTTRWTAKGAEDFAPYLWSITQPQYDSSSPAYVSGLKQQGFFEGAQKVGIAAPQVNRRGRDDHPEAHQGRVGPTEQCFVDVTHRLVGQGHRQDGRRSRAPASTVLFLGGQRLAPIFTQSAAVFEFKVPWGCERSNLRYYSDNVDTLKPDRRREGDLVLHHQRHRRPGAAYPGIRRGAVPADLRRGRSRDQDARRVRTHALLPGGVAIKAVIDSAGPTVNARTFAKAAEVGTTFQAGSEWATLFAPGTYASSAAYRLAPWDQGCQCFKPEGGDVPFTP
jgi:hypothetical protein